MVITGKELKNIGVILKEVVQLVTEHNLAPDDSWDPPRILEADDGGEEDDGPPGKLDCPPRGSGTGSGGSAPQAATATSSQGVAPQAATGTSRGDAAPQAATDTSSEGSASQPEPDWSPAESSPTESPPQPPAEASPTESPSQPPAQPPAQPPERPPPILCESRHHVVMLRRSLILPRDGDDGGQDHDHA